jgi:hypothetical protein
MVRAVTKEVPSVYALVKATPVAVAVIRDAVEAEVAVGVVTPREVTITIEITLMYLRPILQRATIVVKTLRSTSRATARTEKRHGLLGNVHERKRRQVDRTHTLHLLLSPTLVETYTCHSLLIIDPSHGLLKIQLMTSWLNDYLMKHLYDSHIHLIVIYMVHIGT